MLLENPAAQPSLASVIESANAEMVKRIVGGPVAAPREAQQTNAPADPDAELLAMNEPAPATQPGPVFNAAALMPAAKTLLAVK